jgi:hypothetical protein
LILDSDALEPPEINSPHPNDKLDPRAIDLLPCSPSEIARRGAFRMVAPNNRGWWNPRTMDYGGAEMA